MLLRKKKYVKIRSKNKESENAEIKFKIENDNFSGRTAKQAMRDAMVQGRAPPMFKRTPSRRQPRRYTDEMLDSKNNTQKRPTNKQEIKSISIPQPAQA